MVYNRDEMDYSYWKCSSYGKKLDNANISHLDWDNGGVCPTTGKDTIRGRRNE